MDRLKKLGRFIVGYWPEAMRWTGIAICASVFGLVVTAGVQAYLRQPGGWFIDGGNTFSIERWQSLIAGLLAIAAAFIAAAPVRKQLHLMRRQSAAAAIPVIKRLAENLEEELAETSKAFRVFSEFRFRVSDRNSYAVLLDISRQYRLQASQTTDCINKHNLRDDKSRTLYQLRTAFKAWLNESVLLANEMVEMLPRYRDQYTSEVPPDIWQHCERIAESLEIVGNALGRLNSQLHRETREAWKRIRELEAVAIGE